MKIHKGKSKSVGYMFLLLLMFVALALYSYGASPSLITSTIWNTNTKVNISLTSGSGTNVTTNVTYLTVYAVSSLTANSSITSGKVINITNSTATDFNYGYANFTFGNALVIEDANDYTISFKTTANSTLAAGGGQSGTSATNVIIDRTTPATPSSLTTAKRVESDTITATVTDSQTTACYISFGLGGIRNTMDYSGSTCTFTVGKDNPADGIYNYKVYAFDGSNETASATAEIEIDALANPARRSPSSLQLEKGAVVEKLAGMNNVQKIGLLILAVIACDMIFGWGIVFKKGR